MKKFYSIMLAMLMCMTCAIFADNLSKDEKTVGAISVDKTTGAISVDKTTGFDECLGLKTVADCGSLSKFDSVRNDKFEHATDAQLQVAAITFEKECPHAWSIEKAANPNVSDAVRARECGEAIGNVCPIEVAAILESHGWLKTNGAISVDKTVATVSPTWTMGFPWKTNGASAAEKDYSPMLKSTGAISVDKTVAFEGPWKTEEFTQEWKTLRSAVGRKVCGNAEHVYCNKHGVCHDLSSAI